MRVHSLLPNDTRELWATALAHGETGTLDTLPWKYTDIVERRLIDRFGPDCARLNYLSEYAQAVRYPNDGSCEVYFCDSHGWRCVNRATLREATDAAMAADDNFRGGVADA